MKKMTKLDMTSLKNGAILECADGEFRILLDGSSYNPNAVGPYNYITHKRDGKFVAKSGIDMSIIGVYVFIDNEDERNEMCQALRYIHGLDTSFEATEVYRATSKEKLEAIAKLEDMSAQHTKLSDDIAKLADAIKSMN